MIKPQANIADTTSLCCIGGDHLVHNGPQLNLICFAVITLCAIQIWKILADCRARRLRRKKLKGIYDKRQ